MEPSPRESLKRTVDDALTTSSAFGSLVDGNLIGVRISDAHQQSICHFKRLNNQL